MPNIRTVSLDKSRDYSGKKAHTLCNGYTLRNAANPGSQASVANAAIVHNARLGVTFTASDVFQWQKKENDEGRTLATLPDHLESLVGKGFVVGIGEFGYQLVPEAIG